jgi:threonine/homoserine/homoserine lactone efflux protein
MSGASNLPAATLWPYVSIVVSLVLVPGVSTAVVLRNSIAGGTRAGVETAAGVNSGSIAYGLVAAFGLAAAMRQWPAAWDVLRWAGTLYLTWLGVRALASAAQPAPPRAASVPVHGRHSPLRNVYEGFLTNLLNPAIASFYLVLVPRFVPRAAPFARTVLVLTAVHVGIAFSWHLVWAAAGGTMARVLGRGIGRRLLDAASAAALLWLALRLWMRP